MHPAKMFGIFLGLVALGCLLFCEDKSAVWFLMFAAIFCYILGALESEQKKQTKKEQKLYTKIYDQQKEIDNLKSEKTNKK